MAWLCASGKISGELAVAGILMLLGAVTGLRRVMPGAPSGLASTVALALGSSAAKTAAGMAAAEAVRRGVS